MIFVDASALLAVMAQEADSSVLVDRLDREKDRLYSGIVVWETVAALCRSHDFAAEGARLYVRDFLEQFRFRAVAIGDREAEIATAAYARYGRGRHPASLNMGDCFAYACATSNRAALIYTGDDFTKTDLAYQL